ncbi:MAG: hypothetical protein LBN02_10610 [Oscillospiraceae bacterium]|nr:hypothetical protein [Oscillospiraceae bacterium]
MSHYVPRTYKNGRARRILLRVALVIIALIVAVLIFLFFYLRRYIVYDADGKLRLVIPWLMAISM